MADSFLEYLDAKIRLLEKLRPDAWNQYKIVRQMYLNSELKEYMGKHISFRDGKIYQSVDNDSEFDNKMLRENRLYVVYLGKPPILCIGGSAMGSFKN